MVECENDVEVGGTFRHVWHSVDGKVMAMQGVYREVVPHDRIVRTECFSQGCDSQMGEQLATLVLEEQGDKTLLTIAVLYPSKEARDATLASGMEHGVAASYDRLAHLLAAGEVSSSSKPEARAAWADRTAP